MENFPDAAQVTDKPADTAADSAPPALPRHRRRGARILWLTASLLGFLLFIGFIPCAPPCSSIDQAKVTILKSKARGIWTSVMTANPEREAVDLPPVWPEDIRWGDPPQRVVWQTPSQYFRYLMSTGDPVADPLQAVPTTSEEDRIVAELNAATLSGGGVKTAPSDAALSDTYCAWHVCRIADDSPADTPFLISKNVLIENGRLVREGDGSARVPLRKVEPFGRKRAVWITRSGGVYDARAKYLTQAQLLPGTNWVEVIAAP